MRPLITTVGQARSPQGSDGYNYVQINDGVTSNVSGGVWFNKAVSFTRSFRLEMAFALKCSVDSDGLAFVMQSIGLNALAQQAGPTIGVWSNVGNRPTEYRSDSAKLCHRIRYLLQFW